MHLDRPLIGIALMLGFCLLAPFADALAKVLAAVLPLSVVLIVRFTGQMVLLSPFLWLRGWPKMAPRVWCLVGLRTLLHLCGVAMMYTSLKYLPLADAVAIAYVMPFVALLLGWAVLGERVGPRRLGACCVGFCGTLMVVQPSFSEVGLPALLPMGVAVIFAGYMLVTRMVAKAGDPVVLQAINGIQGTAILLGICALAPRSLGLLDLNWSDLAPHLSILALIAVVGTVSHLLMAWSLRFAPAATLAPMQYLEIPVATFFGWLIFSDLPNGLAAVGIIVTMAAGLYVIHLEQATAQRLASEP